MSSPDPSFCRICLDTEGSFCSPCRCTGTLKHVHPDCLNQWIDVKMSKKCGTCLFTVSASNTKIDNLHVANQMWTIVLSLVYAFVGLSPTVKFVLSCAYFLIFIFLFLFHILDKQSEERRVFKNYDKSKKGFDLRAKLSRVLYFLDVLPLILLYFDVTSIFVLYVLYWFVCGILSCDKEIRKT
ncbi:hypothetical protein L596_012027 [Steinernema carpocapsae]|nr:hypothetical protein L596_012027 [Steinernema carpocapsae]